jgi:hypothetical protein
MMSHGGFVVRPKHLILSCALAAAFAATGLAAPAPGLKLFEGFAPGLWQITPLDPDSKQRWPNGGSECLLSPGAMLRAGAENVDVGTCGYTVVENGPDRATVTYVCPGTASGRTTLRRSGDAFKVDAQGFANKQPFDMTGEYRRVGSCPAGAR